MQTILLKNTCWNLHQWVIYINVVLVFNIYRHDLHMFTVYNTEYFVQNIEQKIKEF